MNITPSDAATCRIVYSDLNMLELSCSYENKEVSSVTEATMYVSLFYSDRIFLTVFPQQILAMAAFLKQIRKA